MTSEKKTRFNQPLGGDEMPRFAGVASMFRLPQAPTPEGLDVGLIGVGLDIGTSNRTGTRFGPRQIRTESVLIRPYGMATGGAPFDSFQIADLGDVPLNPFNLEKSIDIIERYYNDMLSHDIKPITMGGDHTISLPILRAIAKKHGPVGLVHVDAHADTNDTMFGEKIAHGTIFRRAIEEGLVDPTCMIQLGQRGTGYTAQDFNWATDRGVQLETAEKCWHKSLTPVMNAFRERVGAERPMYLTFDIDGLDPSVAPGTGTPEPAGLTGIQALEIIRGCYGFNLVGADLVEVCPAYDTTGNTALLAANLIFEMLCSLPGCIRRG